MNLLAKIRANARNRSLLRLFLLFLTGIASVGALVIPLSVRPSSYTLSAGDVAMEDIQAPKTLTYVSQVLTNEARNSAEISTAPIFLPADPAITRKQIERLRVALTYITTVRQDQYASLVQKIADLQNIDNLPMSPETAQRILSASDNRWQAIQEEAASVLEQVMRNTIRENQLADAKKSIPTLINFSIPADQADLVSNLVSPFITATSLFSPEQTELAIQNAVNAVQPVEKTYIAGQLIIQRGQIITNAGMEALEEYGLVRPVQNLRDIASAATLVIATAAFIGFYFSKRKTAPLYDLRSLTMIALLFLLFLFAARYVIPNRAVVPYLFPLAAFGLTIASLYSIEIGLIFSLALSILASYGLSISIDLNVFYILSTILGILILGKGRRVSSFILSGLTIGAAGSAVVIAYQLPDSLMDWVGMATLIGAAFLNGMASASISLVFQYFLSQILGVTTALQLLEISRSDHPLLQYILRNAPGTYQHSLQVANLAEQAAEAIGADSLLTRVGALYHDAGKAANSPFFVENQVPGKLDSHDDIPPEQAARVIISHIEDGVQLTKKYRLPPRITDFVREHHGTFLTRYQFTRAVQAAGGDESKVDAALFRYPGPRPRSKETALLMLADGCEARARAELPQNEDELRTLVRKVFAFVQAEGQLDDTTLTLRDLNKAADAFVSTMRSVYHPRIQYPELKPPEQPQG